MDLIQTLFASLCICVVVTLSVPLTNYLKKKQQLNTNVGGTHWTPNTLEAKTSVFILCQTLTCAA